MMSPAFEPVKFQQTRLFGLIDDVRRGHPWLWHSVWTMLALSAVLSIFPFFDPRQINGVRGWEKPAKFFLSVALQFGTVSWALTKLPTITVGVNRAVIIMVLCGWAENIYMTICAVLGQASHFNFSTPITSVAFSLMGLGAVSMTVSAFYIGWQIWRKSETDVWKQAAALGLTVGAALGTIAGAYMGGQTGHWVGGVANDAGGLPLFNWSTTGGDLRVAHFMGLHATQFIPFAALSGDKRVVYGACLAMVVLTAGIFAMGIAGIPLFKA